MGWAPVLLKSPARNAKVCKVQDKTFLHSKLCKKFFFEYCVSGKVLFASRYSRKVPWLQKSSGKVRTTLKSSRKVCIAPEKLTMVMPTENSNGTCHLAGLSSKSRQSCLQSCRVALSVVFQAFSLISALGASLCLLLFTHFL